MTCQIQTTKTGRLHSAHYPYLHPVGFSFQVFCLPPDFLFFLTGFFHMLTLVVLVILVERPLPLFLTPPLPHRGVVMMSSTLGQKGEERGHPGKYKRGVS